MRNRFVVMDLETTGNSPKKGDRIIQIAAVVIEDGEICERFASFINPNRSIPPFIEQLTGISDDIVRNAPSFELIATEIVPMLENAYFVAHNVPFDLSFLQEELNNCGQTLFSGPTLDTVELSRIMMPWADSYKLNQLAERFSLSHENPHQADSDAEVTAEILLKIFSKLESLPLVTCQRLAKLSRTLKSDLDQIMDRIILQKEQRLNEDSNQYDIHRGIALKKLNILSNLDNKGNDDCDKRILDDFDFRLGQVEMINFITEALQSNQHGLIEAGTGIGKSLAYLVPSIFFSKSIDTPLVISTKTIQLQQQLIDHDIPMLRETLTYPFSVALLKGRSHYLSLRKFEQVLYENDNYDATLAKAQILVWLTETETGDIDEINLPSGGKILWNRVSSDLTDFHESKSPWYSRCFYQRALDRAKMADLIITNHALLLADHRSEYSLIPTYNHVIIDEAHHLEAVASHFFGKKLDYLYIHTIISQVGTIDNQNLLSKTYTIFKSVGLEDLSFDIVNKLVKDLKVAIDELFSMLRSYTLNKHSNAILSASSNMISYRFNSNEENGDKWDHILMVFSNIQFLQLDLVRTVRSQSEKLNKVLKMVTPLQQGITSDYFSLIQMIDQTLKDLTDLLINHQLDEVTWIEADIKGAKNAATIYSQPISVSDYLADSFFANKKSVILTSATLTVKDSFDYTINKLGLADSNPMTLSIHSPFKYKEQALVMIPTDLPDIKSVSMEEFVHSIALQIAEIAIITQGRMLVLFTSFDMLKQTHQQLKELVFLDEYMIISQGISGRSKTKLTKNFKAFEKSILLGTSSFWEGVDIPGEDLTALVIVRLPFTPPNDPIFVARNQMIKEKGGNPFTELALPEAIMRFKQGFGRLVRSKDDKGIVFIMDRRITTTGYGKNFLLSLPEVTCHEQPLDDLLNIVDMWLE